MRERNQKEQMKSDVERKRHTGHCVQRIVRRRHSLLQEFVALIGNQCEAGLNIIFRKFIPADSFQKCYLAGTGKLLNDVERIVQSP